MFAGPCRGVCKDGTFLPFSTESGTRSLCPVLEESSEGAVPEGVEVQREQWPWLCLKDGSAELSQSKRLFAKSCSALDQRELWLSHVHCSFMASFPWGLEESVQPVLITRVNNLCALGAFLICARNSTEISAVFMLLPAKFWMKAMLDGFF